MKEYEGVIGLEVHVELSTDTKIFCRCKNTFGALPNTTVCPVCTAMPGALPVLNSKVVEYAIMTGLALNCNIRQDISFDRKNYFYPDLPKAYQISQLYAPICFDGSFNVNGEKIRIKEIHMEEDAGKLIHNEIGETLVDYNRYGVPLLEIVTEPDFKSSEQAVAFLEKLCLVLRSVGVSDCRLEQGSVRCDVNVSVREKGSEDYGVRTEMKNIGSFSSVRRAVDYEINRQIEAVKNGEKITQDTMRWDENENRNYVMRKKENANDYKYFPDPDIPPIHIDETTVEQIRLSLPELPDAKKKRYMSEYSLGEYDAALLSSDNVLSKKFETLCALTSLPKQCANWLLGEVMRLSNSADDKTLLENFEEKQLADIILLLNSKKISRDCAKEVFEKVFLNGEKAVEYIERNSLFITEDIDFVEQTVKQVLSENEKAVNEYKAGKVNAFNFLVGQCMRKISSKASAETVKKVLSEFLEN